MSEIRIVKPEIRNFELVKGEKAWEEVVYSARMSGVSAEVQGEKVFEMIVRNDYSSALEHVIIKFDLKITKGNAPELLEHRMVSHSGYSTRYVKVYEESEEGKRVYEVILPPNLTKEPRKTERFLKTISQNFQLYESLLAEGMPKESARYALPFCSAVGIYHFTINLRSLLNLLGLRLCVRTSPEFRCLASQIYFHLINRLPLLKGLVGCRGLMRGACPESDVTGVRAGKQHPHYPPCPYRSRETEIFIPTFKELREGVEAKKFNIEKAVQVQGKLFEKWASWDE